MITDVVIIFFMERLFESGTNKNEKADTPQNFSENNNEIFSSVTEISKRKNIIMVKGKVDTIEFIKNIVSTNKFFLKFKLTSICKKRHNINYVFFLSYV